MGAKHVNRAGSEVFRLIHDPEHAAVALTMPASKRLPLRLLLRALLPPLHCPGLQVQHVALVPVPAPVGPSALYLCSGAKVDGWR